MIQRMARVAVLGLVACGSGPVIRTQAPSVVLVPQAAAEMAVAWHDAKLAAIAQPVAIGEVVVATIVRDEQLYLVGLDAASGARRWEQPASVSLGHFRDPLAIGEDRLAYLRPAEANSIYPYAELVIADVHSGAPIWASPARVFTSSPQRCGEAVCAISEEPTGDRREHGRLDLATGEYRVDNGNIPLRAVMLSEDLELLDLADYPLHTLGLLGDGRLQWHQRFGSIFPRRWRASQQRWQRSADEMITGSILAGGWYGNTYVAELARDMMTVGLSERTGQVAWRDRGSMLCGPRATKNVRCRAVGMLKQQPRAQRWTENLDVTIEGFDAQTGTTTWSLPVGAAPAAIGAGKSAIAGPTQRMLRRSDDAIVVDFAQGTATAVPRGATFWCLSDVEYAYPELQWLGRYGYPVRGGGQLASVCDDRGAEAHTMPTAAATLAVGARVGDRAVIATRDGVYGFQPAR